MVRTDDQLFGVAQADNVTFPGQEGVAFVGCGGQEDGFAKAVGLLVGVGTNRSVPGFPCQEALRRGFVMEPGDVAAMSTVDSVEPSADEDFAVGLQGDGVDGVVCTQARVERSVEAAVGIEAGDAVALG
ncbi:MAG: hypothetical protein EA425_00475 [Puniceicoccaceae bacterium]|nr:MAG: hypothetical protein EA425_00475 [Puniceicoccaceae bacterium]